jgi:hypothetical protein
MQTLYPDYYAQFRCTADKCPITCCQEWKISVDDDTLKRWAALNPPVDSKLFTYVQRDRFKQPPCLSVSRKK